MRLRRGQIVRVEFLDHVEDGSEPLAFCVYGELSVVNKQIICVDCWCYANKKTKHDSNEKRYTILRSTIKTITQLG